MKIVLYVIVIMFLVAVLAAAYVRLSPTDVARWHQPIDATEDATLAGGAIRVIKAEQDALEQTDRAMRALPRTRVLAGSLEAGLITYETRSKLWGFPDYTTVQYRDGELKLFARLRFGGSDLGVNAARLAAVLAAIKG